MSMPPPRIQRIDITNMDSREIPETIGQPYPTMLSKASFVRDTTAVDLDRGYVAFYNWLKSRLTPKKDPLE